MSHMIQPIKKNSMQSFTEYLSKGHLDQTIVKLFKENYLWIFEQIRANITKINFMYANILGWIHLCQACEV